MVSSGEKRGTIVTEEGGSMRHTARPILVAVATILITAAAGAAEVPPLPGPFECAHAKAARARLLAKRFLQPPEAPADWVLTDVLHERLDLTVDPARRRIDGTVTLTVRSLAADLETFSFRLHPNLSIGSVDVDGEEASWTRTGDGATVAVVLDPARPTGRVFDVTVTYGGVPPPAVFGETGIYFDFDFSSEPLVYTLSEPWLANTWWPVKEDNRDKATAEVAVTVPSELTVVSNGVLEGVEDASTGWRRWSWRTDYPLAPYLLAFSAGAYRTFGDTFTFDGGTMPVEFWILPESDTPANRQGWLRVVDMLGTLSGLYGLYPFAEEKYGLYQFSFGGGMEHQTATGQSGFSEGVTSHELGHQWWGDLVTCATWHDIWLNEGFATYTTALWWEYRDGTDDREALAAVMDAYRPDDPDQTVYVYDDSSIERIFSSNSSYAKGSWVLHMLRGVAGDDAFFTILRAWRERFAFRSATTEDFRTVVESVLGRDMGWFFDEWVYGAGAPAFRWGRREVQAAGQRWLELSLRQTQEGRLFTMPVTVRVRTASGSRDVVVHATAAAQAWTLPLDGPAEAVELDPGGWILAEGWTPEPFQGGPPHIVATRPAPGAAAEVAPDHPITVTFQSDVLIDAADVSLVDRLRGRTVPLEVTWDESESTATLTPSARLAPGLYRLTVHDSVTGTAGGLALDGEVPGDAGVPGLPSGDGLPGGDAEITFSAIAAASPTAPAPARSRSR